MSAVTDLYQAYLTRLTTVLPNGYKRLAIPYKPEDNADLILAQGYGLTLGAAENSRRTMANALCIQRKLSVVLTRQYTGRHDDGVARALTEKQLLEDAHLVQADIQANRTLGGIVMSSRWAGDSGLAYIGSDTNRFLVTQVELDVEYLEDIVEAT